MNNRFREILDNLPDPTSRSCLAPYRDLIQELRYRKRSYREIAYVLAEKCGIRVSLSTLHEFVQRHLSKKRRSLVVCTKRATRDHIAALRPEENWSATQEEVRQRIEALKRKPSGSPNQPTGFEFDASEPLRLRPEKV
jgi:IS30 family transposase